MANMYERLVAAGAPEVPEPYFLRIRESEMGYAALEVQLRQRLPYGGSERIASRTVYYEGARDVLEGTVEAIRYLVDKYVDLPEWVPALVGDHGVNVPESDTETE
ncbi:hypothetical protein SEA_EMOTION_56 [Arthrobacter phage Emotion]|uniref:Uncharacterized protein n=1 Tax=Arthrobacter phage Emotion TaxID=3038361 RepID=A0AA49ES76_9CAUD|nr:hypothetical protein SEA_EMOTION_56 [Arthrobacter phage Emotion]